MLAGSAAAARPVFGSLEPEPAADAGDASFATLHGLFWLMLNLAADRPLVLAIDDLHWCDRPSLRFLAYVTRRLDGLPVLLGVTLRAAEPGSDPALLSEIANDLATSALRPGPLTDAAVGSLVHAALGGETADAFCAAVHTATGGNPLLVRQLLRALEAEGVRGDAASAGVVREIGPSAVALTVLVRLARQPPEALAVARAVAVLGEGASLAAVAALAGVDEEGVARAAGELARAEILRPEPPLGFVHALVRDAVYREMPHGERALWHARGGHRAARARRAGRPGRRPAAERSAAGRASGRRAAARRGPRGVRARRPRRRHRPAAPRARGAADAGAPHRDPARARARGDDGRRPRGGGAPAHRVRGAGGPGRARGDCGDPHQDPRVHRGARGVLRAREPGAGRAAAGAARPAPAPGGAARGRRALGRRADRRAGCAARAPARHRRAGRRGAHARGDDRAAAHLPRRAARRVRRAHRARDRRRRAARGGRRAVSRSWCRCRGELHDATESLRTALGELEVWHGAAGGDLYAAAHYSRTLFERGDVDGAQALFDPAMRAQIWTSLEGERWWRAVECDVLLAAGRAEEALAVSGRIRAEHPYAQNPASVSWRSPYARALHRLGRTEEAVAVARENLEVARRYGARSTVGRALREVGELQGEDGLEELEASVALLEDAPARLELAKSLAALGRALRHARGGGRGPRSAREPLRRALELADACGAAGLAEDVRTELYAAGARPRTAALSGAGALTASERRIAALAAEGASNRDIAQALFVTPKTVEVHLSNVYRKLGIRSRRDLAGALT